MAGYLEPLSRFIKVHYGIQQPIIDNIVSRLHYQYTASILFLGFLISIINYRGNQIDCMPHDIKLKTVINSYCWISSKFYLPEALVNEGDPKPYDAEREKIKYEAYYQWIPFFFFFQSVLFSIPRWFWKNWENSKISKLSQGLGGTIAETNEDIKERRSKLVQCIISTSGTHNWYAIGYYFTEILNFLAVVGNIYFTDKLLGGNFLNYGIKAFENDNNNDTSPFIKIFPHIIKCKFRQIGASGTIQLYDTICVLALNILNEKIFIFLWWWFIILAIISGLALIYDTLIIVSPAVRHYVFFNRFDFKVSEGARTIVSNAKFGDFFLLYLLGQNINLVVYNEFLEDLSSKMGRYVTNAPSDVTTCVDDNQSTRRRAHVSSQKQSLSLVE